MRLSFVVPAYNEEAYLPACLESILAQTRSLPAGQAEIIVVNNASTDRTREVALSFPGVTLVDEPRKGLTFARQAGFAAATGSLIANVDADSRLTPGWVAQVLSTFADAEHCFAASCTEQKRPLVALSGPILYYDLTPRQRVLVHLFYLTAWTTYAINRYILRVGSMVQAVR
jgi:glycosyltransferase involved in cell wall biosynthesis